MKKTKKTIVAGGCLLSLVALGGVLASTIEFNSTRFVSINATDCSHEHVEHYEEALPTDSSLGHVEHWACCNCHTAWSDEGLTNVIGNTHTDRSKIDTYAALLKNTDPSDKDVVKTEALFKGEYPSAIDSSGKYIFNHWLDQDRGELSGGISANQTTYVASYLWKSDEVKGTIFDSYSRIGELDCDLGAKETTESKVNGSGETETTKKGRRSASISGEKTRVSFTLPAINYNLVGDVEFVLAAVNSSAANTGDYTNKIYYGSTDTIVSSQGYVSNEWGFKVTISEGDMKFYYGGENVGTTALAASELNGTKGIELQFENHSGDTWMCIDLGAIKGQVDDYYASYEEKVSSLSTELSATDKKIAVIDAYNYYYGRTEYELSISTLDSALVSAKDSLDHDFFEYFSTDDIFNTMSGVRKDHESHTDTTHGGNTDTSNFGPDAEHCDITFIDVQNNTGAEVSEVTFTLPAINYAELGLTASINIYCDAAEVGVNQCYAYVNGAKLAGESLIQGGANWNRPLIIEPTEDGAQILMWYGARYQPTQLTATQAYGKEPLDITVKFDTAASWFNLGISPLRLAF